MSERFRVVCIPYKALYKCSDLPFTFTTPETRGIVLPYAENRKIVSSFVWTQYRNVTDRQTEGISLVSATLCMASHADAL